MQATQPLTEKKEVNPMPNGPELIEKLAKRLERHVILEIATECRTIDELIEKLKAIIEADKD